MNTFDRKSVKSLRPEIDAALAAVAAKHGISIKAGGARFSNNNITFKVEVNTIDASGVVETPGARALKAFYPQYVGKKVNLPGSITGTVVEYRDRRPKYPFVVETPNGKCYKVGEHYLR